MTQLYNKLSCKITYRIQGSPTLAIRISLLQCSSMYWGNKEIICNVNWFINIRYVGLDKKIITIWVMRELYVLLKTLVHVHHPDELKAQVNLSDHLLSICL